MVKFQKTCARIISFVFIFTNVLFAHSSAIAQVAERKTSDNIWNARKKSYDLAALPAGMQPFLSNDTTNRSALKQSLLESTPAIQSALKGGNAPKFVSQKKQSPLVAGLPDTFFANVNIKEVHTGSTSSPVILIEDVHQNLEAQTHISRALTALGQVPGTSAVTVALEGAHGGFKYPLFHQFPNQQLVKDVADAYLASGEISGPAHAGFTSYVEKGLRGLSFVGVDDSTWYNANVAAYKDTKSLKAPTLQQISQLQAALAARKKSTFTPELRAFDAAVEAHRAGQLPLGNYVKTLVASGATSLTIEAFLSAYQMEQSIDFNRVGTERAAVLEKLVKSMNENDLKDLIGLSLGYQSGTVTFGDYYSRLRALCKKTGVDLAKTPHFDNYIRYVLLADGIRADKLFSEINNAEDAVYATLAKTSEQKDLINRSRSLYLAGELVNFSLSSNQWAEYQRNQNLLTPLNLKPFEKFYVSAEARSEKMVGNLLKRVPSSWCLVPRRDTAPLPGTRHQEPGTFVLVSGGYHTFGLSNLLKRHGLSYVVVTPKITKIDSGSASAYLSVFDREKTPLENIFAGKKLFVVNDVPGSDTPMRPGSTGGIVTYELTGELVAGAANPNESRKSRVAAAKISPEQFGEMEIKDDTRITRSRMKGALLKRVASSVKPLHSSVLWILEGVKVIGNTQIATFASRWSRLQQFVFALRQALAPVLRASVSSFVQMVEKISSVPQQFFDALLGMPAMMVDANRGDVPSSHSVPNSAVLPPTAVFALGLGGITAMGLSTDGQHMAIATRNALASGGVSVKIFVYTKDLAGVWQQEKNVYEDTDDSPEYAVRQLQFYSNTSIVESIAFAEETSGFVTNWDYKTDHQSEPDRFVISRNEDIQAVAMSPASPRQYALGIGTPELIIRDEYNPDTTREVVKGINLVSAGSKDWRPIHLPAEQGFPKKIRFNRNGKKVVYSSGNGEGVYLAHLDRPTPEKERDIFEPVWEREDNPELQVPIDEILAPAPGQQIHGFAFSPDGKILAVAKNNEILLIDLMTKKPIDTLRPVNWLVGDLAFGPDGTVLFAGGLEGGVLQVWNLWGAANKNIFSVATAQKQQASPGKHRTPESTEGELDPDDLGTAHIAPMNGGGGSLKEDQQTGGETVRRLRELLGKKEIRDQFQGQTEANLTTWLHLVFKEDHEKILELLEKMEQGDKAAALEINDRFFQEAAPGTAGIRGKLGWGANRINKFTIGKFTLGKAQYMESAEFEREIKNYDPDWVEADGRAAVIARDPRKGGKEIMMRAALLYLAGKKPLNKVYLQPEARSTPQLSFWVKWLHAKLPDIVKIPIFTGDMVTASHNPADNNGIKPYGLDGAQVTGGMAVALLKAYQRVTPDDMANATFQHGGRIFHLFGDPEELQQAYDLAVKDGLIEILGDEADDVFIEAQVPESFHILPDGSFDTNVIDLSKVILYISGLNGGLHQAFTKFLKKRDPNNQIQVVWLQERPDENFSDVPSGLPNPESKAARQTLLDRIAADTLAGKIPEGTRAIGLWADPDVDRPAVFDTISFTGNQQLALKADYIVEQLRRGNSRGLTLADHKEKLFGASTVVSGFLMKEILREAGIEVFETMVGFKFIGELVEHFIQVGQKNGNWTKRKYLSSSPEERLQFMLDNSKWLILGGEESLGDETGDVAHDKNAVGGLMGFIEIIGFWAKLGITLDQRLREIYKTHGYLAEPEEMLSLAQKYSNGQGGTVQFSEAEANEIIGKADSNENLPPNPNVTILGRLRERLNSHHPQAITQIAGKDVAVVVDYQSQEARDMNGTLLFSVDSGHTGAYKHNGINIATFVHSNGERKPKENFVKLIFTDGSEITVRPSGTEPKVKFYVLGRGDYANKTELDAWVNTGARDWLTNFATEIARERFPEKFPAAQAAGDAATQPQPSVAPRMPKLDTYGRNRTNDAAFLMRAIEFAEEMQKFGFGLPVGNFDSLRATVQDFLWKYGFVYDEELTIPDSLMEQATALRGPRSTPLTYEKLFELGDLFRRYPRRESLIYRIVAATEAFYRAASYHENNRRLEDAKLMARVYLAKDEIVNGDHIGALYHQFGETLQDDKEFWEKDIFEKLVFNVIYQALPGRKNERLRTHLLYLVRTVLIGTEEPEETEPNTATELTIPADFAPALQKHGLTAVRMEARPLQAGRVAPRNLLSNRFFAFVLAGSIGQALGAMFFVGLDEAAKIPADANAVYFAQEAIEHFTAAKNSKDVMVGLADEGAKDKSVSLGHGWDIVKGIVTGFVNLIKLMARLEFFRVALMIISYFIGDGVEGTNNLVRSQAVTEATGSNTLFSLFIETPETRLGQNGRYLNDDNNRIGGWSYFARNDAGVTPFDLPSVALKKIAESHAQAQELTKGTPAFDQAVAAYINKTTVLTLGPRPAGQAKEHELEGPHRHQEIFDDLAEFRKQYPGLRTSYPGDGDLLARVLAHLGVNLNGRHIVVCGRSGSTEALASTIAVLNSGGQGQFAHSHVSKTSTDKKYNREAAYDYQTEPENEHQRYADTGVPRDVYMNPRTTADIQGEGVLGMTSVTGVPADPYGESFAEGFARATMEKDVNGAGGTITTNSLLSTPEGNFLIRTTWRSDDIEATSNSIKTSSPEAKKYWNSVAALKPVTNILLGIILPIMLAYLIPALMTGHWNVIPWMFILGDLAAAIPVIYFHERGHKVSMGENAGPFVWSWKEIGYTKKDGTMPTWQEALSGPLAMIWMPVAYMTSTAGYLGLIIGTALTGYIALLVVLFGGGAILLGAVSVAISINGLALLIGDGSYILGKKAKVQQLARSTADLEEHVRPFIPEKDAHGAVPKLDELTEKLIAASPDLTAYFGDESVPGFRQAELMGFTSNLQRDVPMPGDTDLAREQKTNRRLTTLSLLVLFIQEWLKKQETLNLDRALERAGQKMDQKNSIVTIIVTPETWGTGKGQAYRAAHVLEDKKPVIFVGALGFSAAQLAELRLQMPAFVIVVPVTEGMKNAAGVYTFDKLLQIAKLQQAGDPKSQEWSQSIGDDETYHDLNFLGLPNGAPFTESSALESIMQMLINLGQYYLLVPVSFGAEVLHEAAIMA